MARAPGGRWAAVPGPPPPHTDMYTAEGAPPRPAPPRPSLSITPIFLPKSLSEAQLEPVDLSLKAAAPPLVTSTSGAFKPAPSGGLAAVIEKLPLSKVSLDTGSVRHCQLHC